jgi:hypothetical protein
MNSTIAVLGHSLKFQVQNFEFICYSIAALAASVPELEKWKVEFCLSGMFFRSLVGAKPVTKNIEDNAIFNCCIFDDADEKIKSCFTTADNYAAPKYTNYSYKDLV